MRKRILVTGCAGFIGSHLADALDKQGHEVYGIDNLSVGHRSNLKDSTFPWFTTDLRDKEKTASLIKQIQPEVVYHCAAWAHEGLSQFMPILITENNLNIYLNTLIPAISNGMKKMVVFSSMAAYGHQEPPFTEDMETRPVDIYGINKASMEKMTDVLSDVFGFEYTVIRPHNVYGERQSLADPYRNVIGIWMNKLLNNEGFYIYGDGEQSRAFSYVGDMIPALVSLTHKTTHKEIYNIGADKNYTLNELANMLLKVSGKSVEVKHLLDRPQEVKHAYTSNEKAKEELGFEDKTSLEEGLKKMWAWAETMGHQTPQYLTEFELKNEKKPKNW